MAGASRRGCGEDGTTPGPVTESAADPGADAFIGCPGTTPAVRPGITAVRGERTMMLVDMRADEITLPVLLIRTRELNVTGVFRPTGTWPAAAHLAATGQAGLASLVTGRSGLNHAEDALNADRLPGSPTAVQP